MSKHKKRKHKRVADPHDDYTALRTKPLYRHR